VYVYPGEHWQQSVKSAALLLLGVAAPLAVFLLPYLSRPETIPDLRFNFIDLAGAYSNLHNLSYLTRLLILLASFPVSAMIIIVTTVIQYLVSRFVFHRRRWDETGIFELAMLLTGGVLLYGYVAGQVKPHYIVAIMPPLMLFAGHRIWLFHKSLPGRNLPTLFLATLGLFIVALETDSFRLYSNLITDGGSAYAGQMPAIDARSIAGYIEANSASQDTIWVYYNAPEIYWLANREPATNDPTGSWVMEMHNQFWFHRTHEQLLRDRPIFIVGIAEPRYPANIPALTELPLVKNLLAEQYACDFTLISKVTICRRKADE
jgi:hypothetical protein